MLYWDFPQFSNHVRTKPCLGKPCYTGVICNYSENNTYSKPLQKILIHIIMAGKTTTVICFMFASFFHFSTESFH